jgi:hypothetical protein
MSYESTAEPIKIGYLMDFLLPENYPQDLRDDLTNPFDMVFGDAFVQGKIDRPIEILYREVEGLPKGSVKAVIDLTSGAGSSRARVYRRHKPKQPPHCFSIRRRHIPLKRFRKIFFQISLGLHGPDPNRSRLNPMLLQLRRQPAHFSLIFDL